MVMMYLRMIHLLHGPIPHQQKRSHTVRVVHQGSQLTLILIVAAEEEDTVYPQEGPPMISFLFSDVIACVFFMTASLAIARDGGETRRVPKKMYFFHVYLQTFALLENVADGSAPHPS